MVLVEIYSVGAIRRMVDYSSVTVYKNGRSWSFSNNRIFSLNLTFPTVPQYPHILTYFRYFYFIICHFCLEVRVCLCIPPYLQDVGTFGRF